MSSERTTEIWSSRIQTELLALTTDDASEEAKDMEMLPPFVTVKEHTLDIVKADCKIFFLVKVEPPKQTKETSEETESAEEKEGGEEEEAPKESFIVVSLDPSLGKKADGSIDASPTSYPFQKPIAQVVSGAELFPAGSEIQNGDPVDIDCDWTPSLHLSDAIMNVALKIRESVKRGEPFFAAEIESPETRTLDKAQAGAKKFLSSMTAFTHSELSPKRKPKKAKAKPRKAIQGSVNIGDIVDLAEEPWSGCEGMFPCNAIRRPAFITAKIADFVAQKKEEEVSRYDDEDENVFSSGPGNYMKLQAGSIGKVAGAGLSGAGSMFNKLAASAKSVFDESFLMITNEYIIELRSSKLNVASGRVTYAMPIASLAKLKFRRQESISLFFKQAPEDPLIYMCPESAVAVHTIQNVLKLHGVKGKHTNAASQRTIQVALNMVAEIHQKEKDLKQNPSMDGVNEIMDLYRQAAEKFESAGDARHQEVMDHTHKFLAKPFVVSILDGSYTKKEDAMVEKISSPVPEGEVLDNTHSFFDDDDDDDDNDLKQKKSDDSDFHDQMENLLLEAKSDLENFTVDEEFDDLPEVEDKDDAVAELDAMFSAADKELSDALNS